MTVLKALTNNGADWMVANMEYESWQEVWDGVIVDGSYMQDILDGMNEEGLCYDTDYCILRDGTKLGLVS